MDDHTSVDETAYTEQTVEESKVVTAVEQHTNKVYKILYKFRPLLIIAAIVCFLVVGYMIVQYVGSRMPKDHIYVCDNPKVYSDFDNWLVDDLGCQWVPSYVIIHNGYVIGMFNGDCSINDFDFNLSLIMSQDIAFTELPNYEIENINGDRVNVHDLFKEGYYVLELHWIDCPDCKHQDANYTDDVYFKYSTDRIYRYYFKSDRTKVEEKYK